MAKNIIVIYHGGCHDGFGGAWAAYKKFGNKADYLPAHHQESMLNLRDKEIYFIDFIYNSPEIVKNLIKNNKKVTIIDHHPTAEQNVKLSENYSFDLKHSGAVLAWKYFHHKKPVPKLLEYIEDCDLWKFKIANSKEISISLQAVDFNFSAWNRIVKDFEFASSRKKYIEQGKLIWKHQFKLMYGLVNDSAYLVEFNGHKTFAINAPHYLASDLGHLLYNKMPPMAIIWNQKGDDIKVSLRSDGSVDVGKLAQKHGGGGHKAAAGFKISANKKLPWEILR